MPVLAGSHQNKPSQALLSPASLAEPSLAELSLALPSHGSSREMKRSLCLCRHRHTHSRGTGTGRVSRKAALPNLTSSSTAASQASRAPEEPLLQIDKCLAFPSASQGTGRSCYIWHQGEGRENMNNSRFSERSVSCAAAAVQASPNSTSYCFGSRYHTVSACFLTGASSRLLSSPFSACLQEQLALQKKSKHQEERLHVPEGGDNTRQVTA